MIVQPATSARKPYLPTIEVVDEGAGRYAVESENFPGVMYLADICMDSCECKAGQSGRPCKHRHIARGYHEARRQARFAAHAALYPDPVAALLECYPA